MANTYSILLVQTVFAVKHRNGLIHKSWKNEFHSIIGNLINETECQSILVNGVADHVHCLFGFRPKHSLSDVLQHVKSKSSRWVNESKIINHKFEWQKGFGAFTYSHGQIDQVYQYIKNQEEHHKKVTFLEEYEHMLKKYKIEYDPRYIFKEPE